jgi:hypothetical protein
MIGHCFHACILLSLCITGLARAERGDSTLSTMLSVHTDPAGARVYVDGADRGISPIESLAVSRGRHILVLRCEQFATIEDSIDTAVEPMAIRRYTLVPASSLSITSIPTGAAVFVSGIFQGRTPLVIGNLSSGLKNIRVMQPLYYPVVDSVVLQPGVMSQLSFVLKTLSARLRITSLQKGVQVSLNDNIISDGVPVDTLLPPGSLQVVATQSATGRIIRSDLFAAPNSTVVLGVEFGKKSIAPLLYSLVWPGMGQWIAGHKEVGWGFALVSAGTATMAILGQNSYSSKSDEYNESRDQFTRAVRPADAIALRSTVQSRYDATMDAYHFRNAAVAAFVGVYILSAVDAFFLHNSSDMIRESVYPGQLGQLHLMSTPERLASLQWRIML